MSASTRTFAVRWLWQAEQGYGEVMISVFSGGVRRAKVFFALPLARHRWELTELVAGVGAGAEYVVDVQAMRCSCMAAEAQEPCPHCRALERLRHLGRL